MCVATVLIQMFPIRKDIIFGFLLKPEHNFYLACQKEINAIERNKVLPPKSDGNSFERFL
jgi:hypothetical protein